VCVCVCSYSLRTSERHSLPGILCMWVGRYEYESGREKVSVRERERECVCVCVYSNVMRASERH